MANTQSIPVSAAGSTLAGERVEARLRLRPGDLERGVEGAGAMMQALGHGEWVRDVGDVAMHDAGGEAEDSDEDGDFGDIGVLRHRDDVRLREVLASRSTESHLILSVLPLPVSTRILEQEFKAGQSSRMPTASKRGTGKRVKASAPMADMMVVMLDGMGATKLADGTEVKSAVVRNLQLLGCTVHTSMSSGATPAITAAASINSSRLVALEKHRVPVLRPGWVDDCVKIAGRAPFGDHRASESLSGGWGGGGHGGGDGMLLREVRCVAGLDQDGQGPP